MEAQGDDDTVGAGETLLTYEPGQGFFLENVFDFTNEKVSAVGEYMPHKNAFNFYVTENTGELVGGNVRSLVRIEMRSSGASMWIAETFTHIDGKEVQVQQYRFTKP